MSDAQKTLINIGIATPPQTNQELKEAVGKIFKRFKEIDSIRYYSRFPEDRQMRLVVDEYFRHLGEASSALWETLPDSLKPAGTEIIFKMWDYLKGEIDRRATGK